LAILVRLKTARIALWFFLFRGPGAIRAFCISMRKNPREAGIVQSASEEIAALERALDRAYSSLRKKARADWERSERTKPDPSNTIVSVRVGAASRRAASNACSSK
jgi:hypothetical protein